MWKKIKKLFSGKKPVEAPKKPAIVEAPKKPAIREFVTHIKGLLNDEDVWEVSALSEGGTRYELWTKVGVTPCVVKVIHSTYEIEIIASWIPNSEKRKHESSLKFHGTKLSITLDEQDLLGKAVEETHLRIQRNMHNAILKLK